MDIIVEDGSGVAGANSYASVQDGDDYSSAHLYATLWTGADQDRKETALMMATRTLDSVMEWLGWPTYVGQALGFPRTGIAIPSENAAPWVWNALTTSYVSSGQFFAPNAIPKGIKDATCELARLLMGKDLTADAKTKGIKSFGAGQNAVAVTFDAADRPGVLPDVVLFMLQPFGSLRGSGVLAPIR